jgi:cobalt-zinc-cadmium efflux system outer membrane protein
MSKKWLFVAVIMWGCQVGVAQAEPLSFPVAFQQVLQHNPRLFHLRQQIEMAEARLPQAAALTNPEISLNNEDFLGSAGWTDDRFTQFTLEWAQTFWWAAQPALRQEVAAQHIAVLRWEYTLAQRQLWFELQQHFYQIRYLEQQVVLANTLREQASQLLVLNQRLVELGRLAPAVLLTAEVGLQQQEADTQHWQTLLQQERLRLVSLWGGETVDFKQVQPSDLPVDPRVIPALEKHPRLLRWETWQRLRQETLKLSQAEAIPPLTLSGGPRYHPPGDWGLLFTVRAPVPILNANQGEIAAAQLALEQLPQEYAQERKALQRDWQEAYAAWEAAREQLKLVEAQQMRLEKVAVAFHQALTAGKQTAQDVIVAEQAVVRKRQQVLEARHAERLAALRCSTFQPQLWPLAKGEPNS